MGSCDIRPGRRPRGAERLALLTQYQQRAGLEPSTSNEALGGVPGGVEGPISAAGAAAIERGEL